MFADFASLVGSQQLAAAAKGGREICVVLEQAWKPWGGESRPEGVRLEWKRWRNALPGERWGRVVAQIMEKGG